MKPMQERYKPTIRCVGFMILFRILLFSRKNLVLSFQANIFSIALCNFLDVKIISRSNSSSSGWSQNIIKQTIFKFYFPRANIGIHDFIS